MRDEDSAALAAQSIAAAAVAAVQTVSPGWGIAAGAAQPAVALAIAHWQRLQARRTTRTLGAAADAAGLTPDQVVEKLIATDEGLALLANALAAANRTGLDLKVEALGRSLGSLVSDPALMDPESLWIHILSDIEAPHVRVMQHLLREDPEQSGHMIIATPRDFAHITGSGSMALVILKSLMAVGLADEVDKAGIGPQSRARWGIDAAKVNPVWYMRGPLTQECIERLAVAGGRDSSL